MVDLLLNPLVVSTLLVAAALASVLRARARGGKTPWLPCLVAFLALWAGPSRGVSTALLEILETGQQVIDPAEVAPPDAIVVLGAGIRDRTARPAVLGEASVQRMLEGVRLARAWPGAHLLFSGGDTSGRHEATAVLMARQAAQCGVDEARIEVEDRSTTTRENVLFTAEIVRQRGWTRVVLVTSASHMPRSQAAFRKVGLDPRPAPCDFTTTGRALQAFLVPSLEGPQRNHAFLHEVVGRLWYRLRGWA
jgi:uncharacterized SAM-binding protein YcdF (DUF218 family)